MKRVSMLLAAFGLAALARAGAAAEADPSRIVVDPDTYLGRPVTVAVKFLRIEQGRELWEEQANLTAATAIKFRVTRLREIKCYAPRTQRNAEALTGLEKGTRLLLSGVVKKYRTKVVTKYEVSGKGHRRVREVTRVVRGRVRYAFMVDSISRAK